jgi:hypothetical protein
VLHCFFFLFGIVAFREGVPLLLLVPVVPLFVLLLSLAVAITSTIVGSVLLLLLLLQGKEEEDVEDNVATTTAKSEKSQIPCKDVNCVSFVLEATIAAKCPEIGSQTLLVLTLVNDLYLF